jgi:hypothetical protein
VIFNRDSGTERATILISIKHNRNQVTLRTLTQRLPDLAHHLNVENIQRRPRKSNPPNAILDSDTNVLISAHDVRSQSR